MNKNQVITMQIKKLILAKYANLQERKLHPRRNYYGHWRQAVKSPHYAHYVDDYGIKEESWHSLNSVSSHCNDKLLPQFYIITCSLLQLAIWWCRLLRSSPLTDFSNLPSPSIPSHGPLFILFVKGSPLHLRASAGL